MSKRKPKQLDLWIEAKSWIPPRFIDATEEERDVIALAYAHKVLERRVGPQPATDAQLDAVAADYAETMRSRGFCIGVPEETAIRRAAGIQDAWRVAFARVIGS